MPIAGTRDYYAVLEVNRGATQEEVKQAYRRLARQHHPDRNPGDPTAELRFKEVSEAYHVLGDADRRAHYDRFGAAPGGMPAMDFVDMTDMFESIVGDFLSGIGNFGRAKKSNSRDLKLDVEITLTEAARGVEKTVE